MPCCCFRKKSHLKDAIERKNRLCVWMLGSPGSGKGTQCEKLAAQFQLSNVSPGDLLRNIILEECPLADEIRATMERGDHVDTKLVLKLLERDMEESYPTCRGYIIDGYPRELKQGKLFCKLIGKPHVIVYLDCPDYYVLTERFLKGGVDSGRLNDNEETMKGRTETYHRISKPVIEHWSSLVVRVDATGSPEEVERGCINAIQTALNDFKINRP